MKYLIILLLFCCVGCTSTTPDLSEGKFVITHIEQKKEKCLYKTIKGDGMITDYLYAPCGLANIGDTLKICKK